MEANRKTRRRHTAQFKSEVVAACQAPGASVAGVAMAFGVNANLVRQWRQGRGFRPAQAPAWSELPTPLATTPAFLPVSLPTPEPKEDAAAPAPSDIHIEVRRCALQVNVTWPSSAAAECASWLRELLR